MTVKEKLLIIQRVSGLTQEKLARRLGVTFAALNRWVNGRAVPRKAAEARVDELYRELTGVKEIPERFSPPRRRPSPTAEIFTESAQGYFGLSGHSRCLYSGLDVPFKSH